MRLFIGSFLDEELLGNIPFDNIQKLFKDDLKSVKKENIHMTWVFLGDIETCRGTLLQEMIDKHINLFKDLTFQSKSLELWPPKRSPRLIVLSGEFNKSITLNLLIRDLKTVCNPDEKENFLPHITVARFKKDKTVGVGFKPTLPKIENFIWHIKEVSLIQSVLSSKGPSYIRQATWKV